MVKLDMGKAYDRVSWVFLTKVMRKFEFVEFIIGIVWRLLSNNWYTVLINVQSKGFFFNHLEVKARGSLITHLFYHNC